MQTDVRAREIQSRANEEKAEVTALLGRVSDSDLKKRLQLAMFWLDDVEDFLLPHALRADPAHVTMWIEHAEATLRMAAERRRFVQEIVATYGPDAVSVGV
jgi:hypothetical protein